MIRYRRNNYNVLNEISIESKYNIETQNKKTSRDFQEYKQICLIDPTYNKEKDIVGKYTNWLLQRIENQEDMERVRVPLEWYADGMKRGILKRYGIEGDINRYKTIDDFVTAMKTITQSNDDIDTQMSSSEYNQRQKLEGQFKIIGESKYWEIISPTTFRAERWFGRETEWCTVANESFFKQYGGPKGKLFIFYPKNGELKTRIQVEFSSYSYCDVNDINHGSVVNALFNANESNKNILKDAVSLASDVWKNDKRYEYQFINGFAWVELNGKQNFIDTKGKFISDQWFESCHDFDNGFAWVELNGKQNFIDTKGKFISDQWFESCHDFDNGFAWVELNGKQNFIDTQGNIISDQWFDDSGVFVNGFAAVRLNGKQNFIDTKGKFISDQWFESCHDFDNGFAWVELNGKQNFIDTKGKFISDQWFDVCYCPKNGYFMVMLNDKYNFIDTKGKFISDQWFDECYCLKNGYFVIELDKKQNFIDTQGKFISDQWFDECYNFSNGFGMVELNGKWNFIDTQGNIISDQWFDDSGVFVNGFAAVRLNGKQNFIDTQGKFISDQWFDECYNFSNGFGMVELNDKYNYIGTKGKFISDQWFDECDSFEDGFANVQLNDRRYLINTKGQLCDVNTWEPIENIKESNSHNIKMILMEPHDIELIKDIYERYGSEVILNHMNTLNEAGPNTTYRDFNFNTTGGSQAKGILGAVQSIPSFLIMSAISWPATLIAGIGALSHRFQAKYENKQSWMNRLNSKFWSDYVGTPRVEKGGSFSSHDNVKSQAWDKIKKTLGIGAAGAVAAGGAAGAAGGGLAGLVLGNTKDGEEITPEKLENMDFKEYWLTLSNNEILRVRADSEEHAKAMANMIIAYTAKPCYEVLNTKIQSGKCPRYTFHFSDGEMCYWSAATKEKAYKEALATRKDLCAVLNKMMPDVMTLSTLESPEIEGKVDIAYNEPIPYPEKDKFLNITTIQPNKKVDDNDELPVPLYRYGEFKEYMVYYMFYHFRVPAINENEAVRIVKTLIKENTSLFEKNINTSVKNSAGQYVKMKCGDEYILASRYTSDANEIALKIYNLKNEAIVKCLSHDETLKTMFDEFLYEYGDKIKKIVDTTPRKIQASNIPDRKIMYVSEIFGEDDHSPVKKIDLLM